MPHLSTIQPILDRFKNATKEIYGDRLVKVLLYGSYARGEQHDESDIDLMVVLKDEGYTEHKNDPRLFQLTYHIQMDTGYFLSPVLTPFTKFTNDRTIFLHFVRKDGVIIV